MMRRSSKADQLARVRQQLGIGTKAKTTAKPKLEGAPKPERTRTTAKASGSRGFYSNSVRWRREAKAYLATRPLCECEDRCGQPSKFVDHIQPIKDPTNLADPAIWDRANWQALSDRCHRLKSRIELGQTGRLAPVRRKSLRIKGCDPATGMPLDPSHWWNTQK